ncbi:Asp/Glu/hydantoin racemase [Plectosphaerella cucumerina]|uniref:Asp/Glu/hydantoin racemase n=1 Tax=Plectosphaerella cucumerina TaxID=40658 RepID=A0A8K0X2S5_9PEZI|nr:Asp/Glu/hydantoin racemase [Plectosphaerella cucumerina]
MNILVVNPNSSVAMTEGMLKAIQSLDLPESIKIKTYTAPSDSPASIDNGEDIRKSAEVALADLTRSGELEKYDGILVACYSVHTLVDKLARQLGSRVAVTGIFEASILAAAALLPHTSTGPPESQWGIVTTGEFWEKHLSDGVRGFLGEPEGAAQNLKFRGVVSTGLTAGDFHHVSPEEVRAKLVKATEKLLGDGGVGVVAMGCGGMAGLEEIIRETAVARYGAAKGGDILVVDGVKAGVLQLEQMIRSKKAFQGRS